MRSKRLPCIALFGVCALAVAPGPVRASRAIAAIVGYVAARRGAWGREESRVRGGEGSGTKARWDERYLEGLAPWFLHSCDYGKLGPFPYEAVCVSAHVLFWDLSPEFHPGFFATVTRVRFRTLGVFVVHRLGAPVDCIHHE